MNDTLPLRTPARPLKTAATVLAFDAVTCLAMGLVLVAATDMLATLLGLPSGLLRWAGGLLFACAALMWIAARQRPPAPTLVRLIASGNLAWALGSFGIAFAMSEITPLGRAFVIAQAVAVLVLASLEWRSLSSADRPRR